MDDPDVVSDRAPLLGADDDRGDASSPTARNIQARRRRSIPPTHSKVYDVDDDDDDLIRPPSVDTRRPEPINFFKALMLPGVVPYSLAYAALKLVNYSFFFWLPFYLHDAYGWSSDESNDISQWYVRSGLRTCALVTCV